MLSIPKVELTIDLSQPVCVIFAMVLHSFDADTARRRRPRPGRPPGAACVQGAVGIKPLPSAALSIHQKQ